jgi:hypothetical protein
MNSELTPIEYVLIGSLMVSILISGYLTFMRVVYGIHHVTYDSWIFGMNLALLLNIHDSSCLDGKGKNKK